MTFNKMPKIPRVECPQDIRATMCKFGIVQGTNYESPMTPDDFIRRWPGDSSIVGKIAVDLEIALEKGFLVRVGDGYMPSGKGYEVMSPNRLNLGKPSFGKKRSRAEIRRYKDTKKRTGAADDHTRFCF